MKPNFCILVPTYNEENSIVDVIENLDESGYPYLIVDDGSTDFTSMLIRSYAKWSIGYSKNKGKGYAIKRGAKEIIKKGYDWVLIMDSDGQNSLKDLPTFFTALKIRPNACIVMGNRLHHPKDMSLIRLITNWLMSVLISLIIGQRVYDSQCGYRLIHKSIFKLKIKSNRFEMESEMLLRAKKYEIVNVPVKCIYKKGRRSKINPFIDTIRFFKMLKRIK